MPDRVLNKIDSVQVPTGYAVSAGLTTTPAWMNSITTWLDFSIIVIGVAVGLTTLWINVMKIKRMERERNANKVPEAQKTDK